MNTTDNPNSLAFDIETLIQQSNSQQYLVTDTKNPDLSIHQNQDFRWLFHRDQTIVTLVNLHSPERLIADYQTAMLFGLMQQSKALAPLQILNLGMAGGAFERWFSQHSISDVVSVELDPLMIAIAQQYFLLPANARVINTDAFSYLKQARTAQFDLILADISDGEAPAPCLLSSKFYQCASNALTATGVMTVNLLPNSEQALLDVLLPARQAFKSSMLIDIPQCKNIVLVLSNNELTTSCITSAATQTHLPLSFDSLIPFIKVLP